MADPVAQALSQGSPTSNASAYELALERATQAVERAAHQRPLRRSLTAPPQPVRRTSSSQSELWDGRADDTDEDLPRREATSNPTSDSVAKPVGASTAKTRPRLGTSTHSSVLAAQQVSSADLERQVKSLWAAQGTLQEAVRCQLTKLEDRIACRMQAMESQDFGDKLQSRLRALEGKVCSEVEARLTTRLELLCTERFNSQAAHDQAKKLEIHAVQDRLTTLEDTVEKVRRRSAEGDGIARAVAAAAAAAQQRRSRRSGDQSIPITDRPRPTYMRMASVDDLRTESADSEAFGARDSDFGLSERQAEVLLAQHASPPSFCPDDDEVRQLFPADDNMAETLSRSAAAQEAALQRLDEIEVRFLALTQLEASLADLRKEVDGLQKASHNNTNSHRRPSATGRRPSATGIASLEELAQRVEDQEMALEAVIDQLPQLRKQVVDSATEEVSRRSQQERESLKDSIAAQVRALSDASSQELRPQVAKEVEVAMTPLLTKQMEALKEDLQTWWSTESESARRNSALQLEEHVKEAVAQACAPKAEEGAGSAVLQDIQPALEERILELRQELEPVLKEKIQALEQDLQSVLDQQPRCVTQAVLEERLRLLKEHLEGCLASKAEDNNGRASEQLEVLQKDLQPFIAEQIRQAADPEVSKASWEPWLEGRLEAWKGDLQPFLVEHIQTTQQASVAELAFSLKSDLHSGFEEHARGLKEELLAFKADLQPLIDTQAQDLQSSLQEKARALKQDLEAGLEEKIKVLGEDLRPSLAEQQDLHLSETLESRLAALPAFMQVQSELGHLAEERDRLSLELDAMSKQVIAQVPPTVQELSGLEDQTMAGGTGSQPLSRRSSQSATEQTMVGSASQPQPRRLSQGVLEPQTPGSPLSPQKSAVEQELGALVHKVDTLQQAVAGMSSADSRCNSGEALASLTHDMGLLSKECQHLAAEQAALRGEGEQANKELVTLAQRVESVIADSKGATNEHQSKLVKDWDALVQKVDALQHAVDCVPPADAQRNSIEELASAMQKVDVLSQECKQLAAEQTAIRDEAQQMNEELLSTLVQRVDGMLAEGTSISNEYQMKQSQELDALVHKVAAMQQAVDGFPSVDDRHNSAEVITSLTQKMDLLSQACKDLAAEQIEVRGHGEQTSKELATLVRRVEDELADAQRATNEHQIQQAQEELGTLAHKLDVLQQTVAGISSSAHDRCDTPEALTTLRDKLDQISQECKDLASEQTALRSEAGQTNKDFSAMVLKFDALKETVAGMPSADEKRDSLEALTSLGQRVDLLTEESKQLAAAQTAICDEGGQTNKELASLVQRVDDLVADGKHIAEHNGEPLQALVEASDLEASDLHPRIEALEVELKSLVGQTQACQAQLRDAAVSPVDDEELQRLRELSVRFSSLEADVKELMHSSPPATTPEALAAEDTPIVEVPVVAEEAPGAEETLTAEEAQASPEVLPTASPLAIVDAVIVVDDEEVDKERAQQLESLSATLTPPLPLQEERGPCALTSTKEMLVQGQDGDDSSCRRLLAPGSRLLGASLRRAFEQPAGCPHAIQSLQVAYGTGFSPKVVKESLVRIGLLPAPCSDGT